MKRFVNTLVIGLVFLLLFSGCGHKEPLPTDETSPFSNEIASSQEPSQGESVPDHQSSAPSEEDGMARSPLSNELVSAETAKSRPIAVIIPNEAHAIPHYNISKASVLYEARVEGSMTRLMGIFEDWEDIQKLGNVRSLRSYFAYWAFEWDAIIVHYGGPYFIYDLLAQDGTENIDGMHDESAFFRTDDREMPHNAYTSGPKILSSINKNQYAREYRGLTVANHFQFTAPDEANTLSQYGDSAVDAAYIDMTASYPLTRCYFHYNESDGCYYRYQYLSGGVDGPHIDGATGEQLTFSNIIVQRVKQEEIGNGYLAMQCHDTTRDGYFFTRGKCIHVTWEKISDYGATKFYDDNGKEVLLNTGKTMILIIRDSDSFSYR